MNYCDANAVAYETAAERYTNIDPPTLCDCGSVAERGQVYCEDCLNNIDFVMRNAIKILVNLSDCSEDEAEQMACYWLENMEAFYERRI